MLGIILAMGFSATLLMATPADAETQQSSTAQSAQNTSGPAEKFVQDLGDKAVRIIADKNLSPAQRSQKYDGILREAFDLPTIGKFVLGRAWKTATPQQQQEYMKLFEATV